MFMLRLRQFKEKFPDAPQRKGKGKRKSKGEESWKQKIMKTASGQRIQAALESKGKCKGGKGGKGKEPEKGKAKKGPAVPGKGTAAVGALGGAAQT